MGFVFVMGGVRHGSKDAENGLRLRSRIAQILDVLRNVRLGSSLAVALPQIHFEHLQWKD
jgi:hypothetical protein